MATEMVNLATSEKLKEMDWMKNIEICQLVAHDPGKAKDVVKAIKKHLKNKNGNAQLFAVKLLEMLMNNCGEHVHKQIFDNGLLPILVKIVKKKTDLPVRERIFLLLDATQTALGGASGKFPQYFSAYYDLVSSGVKFAQRPRVALPEGPAQKVQAKVFPPHESLLQKCENGEKQSAIKHIPESSIIHKATSALEVLWDVLNAMNPMHPEGATEEFVLDLVEQCSFQKQRVMHLVMTCRDEKVVTEAIELNEQLHKTLTKHDALLLVCATSNPTSSINEEVEEEEDVECLYRRMRKGKACIEDHSDGSVGSFRSIPEEKMQKPLIRPLRIQPSDPEPRTQYMQPLNAPTKQPPIVSLPPPPAKHMERMKFFEDRHAGGLGLAGRVRGQSLHSHNGSSSHSGSSSSDYGERDAFGL